ncbi:hypothetical protein VTN00DRAFT_492 [Thermoascus crustaceus]|uniref:uncharacterized protein n=1 Tax=Thermoascus crustaceus TaxID=5088 RepID=UPI003742FC24
MSALTTQHNLSLPAAQIAAAACTKKAESLGVPMNIAIVDATLYLLHFSRMPGAKLTSIDIAINKAFTAAGHKVPTHVYKENVWPGGPAYGINNSNGGRFMVIGGGVPIVVDGEVVGAIGCSTGTPDQDRQVAQAGVDAVMEVVEKSRRAKL